MRVSMDSFESSAQWFFLMLQDLKYPDEQADGAPVASTIEQDRRLRERFASYLNTEVALGVTGQGRFRSRCWRILAAIKGDDNAAEHEGDVIVIRDESFEAGINWLSDLCRALETQIRELLSANVVDMTLVESLEGERSAAYRACSQVLSLTGRGAEIEERLGDSLITLDQEIPGVLNMAKEISRLFESHYNGVNKLADDQKAPVVRGGMKTLAQRLADLSNKWRDLHKDNGRLSHRVPSQETLQDTRLRLDEMREDARARRSSMEGDGNDKMIHRNGLDAHITVLDRAIELVDQQLGETQAAA